MAINIRCSCGSESNLSMKQCRGCGETFPKKGRKYKVVVRANGKKISKTVPNLELAREVERKIKLDIVRNDFDLNRKKNAQQLKTVWNDYFVWAQSNKKSWYTDLLNYEKHLAPSLSNKPLDKISPFDIEAIMLNMKRGRIQPIRNTLLPPLNIK
ncbi:MAG: hypothetical protein QTN59_10915 [Candidatus Electrothrix communis]|nr:MAG: hypothetical protein QTN59_10915 [Candidatus Electrothrix communis]